MSRVPEVIYDNAIKVERTEALCSFRMFMPFVAFCLFPIFIGERGKKNCNRDSVKRIFTYKVRSRSLDFNILFVSVGFLNPQLNIFLLLLLLPFHA